ncbi:MAG: DUF4917 family protein [Bryobacterales bacterium]|nr:DUF4917 family protein [Bryobacterales bacterium]
MLTFDEAIQKSNSGRRHLLLGNGFSIAWKPYTFRYQKLLETADFSRCSPAARTAFGVLATSDFEVVMRALKSAVDLIPLYSQTAEDIAERMTEDAQRLRELLVETIAQNHPAGPFDVREDEFESCKAFLANFNQKYTTNYDLLLYWVEMHNPDGVRPSSDDGFRQSPSDFEAEYVVWDFHRANEQNMWFLHGALHLFDTPTELQKYTWGRTGVRLIDQIRDALNRQYFPLFVSEGEAHEKLDRIRHSDYLSKALRSFSAIQHALFTFGFSFSPNDEHITREIEAGKVSSLFVGLHGNVDSEENRRIMTRVSQIPPRRTSRRPLDVEFFDSDSAQVWNRPL